MFTVESLLFLGDFVSYHNHEFTSTQTLNNVMNCLTFQYKKAVTFDKTSPETSKNLIINQTRHRAYTMLRHLTNQLLIFEMITSARHDELHGN